MKKIPTLFERKFENHRVMGVTEKVMPGYEWVLQGEGTATVKIDGTCCMIRMDNCINGMMRNSEKSLRLVRFRAVTLIL